MSEQDYIERLSTMTEQELRDFECPWPKSLDELTRAIDALAKRAQEYGTCVYSTSLAATLSFHFIAGTLGVTGFQASCADLDVLKRTRGYKLGFCIVDYRNLLYPQYWNDEHFPTVMQLARRNAASLLPEIDKLLAEGRGVQAVRDHWTMLKNALAEGPVEAESGQ